jgi:DNA-binding CsgD family transcriptional regulator
MTAAAAKPSYRDGFSMRLLVVNELTRAGAPLTSRQLADRLNAKLETVTAICSRLASYGQLGKEIRSAACRTCGSPHTFCLWSLPT